MYPGEKEVFANELGGNPRVWHTDFGYRLSFRYQPGELARAQSWALRTGFAVVGGAAGSVLAGLSFVPSGLALLLPPIGLMTGLWWAFDAGLWLGEVLTRQLNMTFDDRSISWYGSEGKAGSVACSEDSRPAVQVVADHARMIQARRSLFRMKRRGEPDQALKVVFTSGPHGIHQQTVLAIMAPDPTEPAVRLASTINLLIECTVERAEQRTYAS